MYACMFIQIDENGTSISIVYIKQCSILQLENAGKWQNNNELPSYLNSC